jgi:hypothetical protein
VSLDTTTPIYDEIQLSYVQRSSEEISSCYMQRGRSLALAPRLLQSSTECVLQPRMHSDKLDDWIGFPRYAGQGKNSIHPPAGTAAILFVPIIGRTEIAVLVKIIFGVLIVLLHVNLEFFSSTAAFPAVITILEPIARL